MTIDMIELLATIAIVIVLWIFIKTYLEWKYAKKYRKSKKHKRHRRHKHRRDRKKRSKRGKKKGTFDRVIDKIEDEIKGKRKDWKREKAKRDRKIRRAREYGKRPDDCVFMDLTTPNEYLGKVVIKLFTDITPHTCENFKILCSTKNINKSYKNCPLHRVIKGSIVQGGDIINGNGTGSYSIYGKQFPDENFKIKHSEAGLISMANSGPNTNGSQFFFTLDALPELDGKHVVFGKVVKGLDIIKRISKMRTNHQDRPTTDVIIKKCGLYQ